jgi:hypothetical protein
VVDVEVPKQYIVGRSIRNSGSNRGKNLMGVKGKEFIRGLAFRGGHGMTLCSTNIFNHDISDTFYIAHEA